MGLRGGSVLKNCKQIAEKCKQIFKNKKTRLPLKLILALPTWDQKCFVSKLWSFVIPNFDLGHWSQKKSLAVNSLISGLHSRRITQQCIAEVWANA